MVPDDAKSSLSDEVKLKSFCFSPPHRGTALNRTVKSDISCQRSLSLSFSVLLLPFLLWMPLCLIVMNCRIQIQLRVEMKCWRRSSQFILSLQTEVASSVRVDVFGMMQNGACFHQPQRRPRLPKGGVPPSGFRTIPVKDEIMDRVHSQCESVSLASSLSRTYANTAYSQLR